MSTRTIVGVRLATLAAVVGIWLALPGSAFAATNVWTSAGPSSGSTLCVAISPAYATDHTVFTGGDFFGLAGIFKSTSSGASWSQAITGLDPGADVHSLVISPAYATDHTVFAATAMGVFRSTSGGAGWSSVDTGFPDYPDFPDGGGLNSFNIVTAAISPAYATDHTVFMGGSFFGGPGLFKSTSLETSWTDAGSLIGVVGGLPIEARVRSIAISPDFATDHTVFVGTEAGVYKSTSGGATWSAVATGLPDFPDFPYGGGLGSYNIAAVAISPSYAVDHTVFMGGSFFGGPGLFKSTNGGASWIDAGSLIGVVGGLPIEARVRSIAISPDFATDHTVFVGTEAGVFKSTSGGESWNPVNTGLTDFPIFSVAVSPDFANDHTIFAAHDAVYSCSLETTPPVTTPTESVERYYSESVTISVTATDNPGGSGVAGIFYTLNGGSRQESSTVSVSTAGTYVLKYWSVDEAGNPEEPHTVTFTIVASPNANGTPSAPSCPSLASTGKSFTTFGYVIHHPAGQSPVKLYFYRYTSGKWVYYKWTYAMVSDFLTFSKYSDSTSVPYSGRWRVRAKHVVGSTTHTSAYTYFTVITTPPSNGTPSTPSAPSTVTHGVAFTTYGYIVRHTSGTYPVTLQFYRYQSGHWVLRKSITAAASNYLTFSKYSRSTSVPYTGKWRVRARHKVGSKYLYSGYRTFTAS
jgi:hypothetical protein